MSEQQGHKLAAIDLGSNSFHMIVVQVDPNGHVTVLDRLREPVRLGNGLDAKGHHTCRRTCVSLFGTFRGTHPRFPQ